MTMYVKIAKLVCAKWVWKGNWGESRLSHECYYCGQILETKEKLYDHLDVHSKPVSKIKKNSKKKIKNEPGKKNHSWGGRVNSKRGWNHRTIQCQ